MNSDAPTQGPAIPPRKPGPMPDWQKRQLSRLVGRLSAWRSADHEDTIVMTRSEVICLLDGLSAQTY